MLQPQVERQQKWQRHPGQRMYQHLVYLRSIRALKDTAGYITANVDNAALYKFALHCIVLYSHK